MGKATTTYSELTIVQQRLGHHYFHFGRDSKGRKGKLYSERGKAAGMPWLEAVGLRKL